ncbi:MAG TPA: polysaccharide deacetylase family protein [Candidatus Paceibacterota bacterium]
MLFDFSLHKLTFLLGLLGGLVVVPTTAVVIARDSHNLVSGFHRYFIQENADFVYVKYLLTSKLPIESKALLASAAGRSTAQGTITGTITPPPGAPYQTAASVPVLLYHGEGDTSSSTMPMHVFVDQMRTLKQDGWHTITLHQFTAFMKGETTLPDKSFLLTFDDARRDTFYAADPVMRDLGFTGVMFVITGFSMPENGSTPVSDFYLSKSELAYLARSGRWELESHGNEDHRAYPVPTATSTPAHLTLLPNEHFLSNLFWSPEENRIETPAEFSERVKRDLISSRDTLEADFGKPVTAFAFPFNDFGQGTGNYPQAMTAVAHVVPSIYNLAFYQTWPGNGDSFNTPDPNASLIKRIEPHADWTGRHLLTVLQNGRTKTLPYASDSFTTDWEANWGLASSTASSSLAVEATTDSTGAAAFLNGSGQWQNYRIDAKAEWQAGTISLVARHTEGSKPYLVCAFSQNRIYLERHEQGAPIVTLAFTPYTPPKLPTQATVSMTVNGPHTTCSAYGASVSADAPGISAHGGIGISVWDTPLDTARILLTRLSVSAL